MVDSSNLFERLRLHLSKTSRSLFWSGSAISQSLDNHNTDHGLKFIETYMSYNFIIKFFLKLFLTEDQAEEIDELEKLCETLSKHGLLNEDNFSKIQKHLHPRKLIQAFIELKKLGINDVDFALDFSSLYPFFRSKFSN